MGGFLLAAIVSFAPIVPVTDVPADRDACAPVMLVYPVFTRGEETIAAMAERSLECHGYASDPVDAKRRI